MTLVSSKYESTDFVAEGFDCRDAGGWIGGLGVVDSCDIVCSRDGLHTMGKAGKRFDGVIDMIGCDMELMHECIDEADVFAVVIARKCYIGRIVSIRCRKHTTVIVVFGAAAGEDGM